ncbi:MAG: glycosyltransferase [Gammaproteobacteria bacterium]|nr:glycosyltransferase [Gammaproteobacteria bacterium]
MLVWGRGARLDGAYSRDRVVYRLLGDLGAELAFFSPRVSPLGDVEARLRPPGPADLVWVPCFRQRDIAAAARFARRRGIPLVFDPLISAYDKQVNERGKFPAGSRDARRLLDRERRRFARADVVVADTAGHADYFHEVLRVPRERLVVLPVGADASVFRPVPPPEPPAHGRPVRLLFYGSFIGLHGVPTIVEALRRYRGPGIACHFVGDGPARAAAGSALDALDPDRVRVGFEGWLEIDVLAARIAEADVVLGIFGTTAKALRVVPNKVYQALATGRPVITADTPAYDDRFRPGGTAPLAFTAPGDPDALADAIARWAGDPGRLAERGRAASELFLRHFSEARLREGLRADLERLGVASFAPGGTSS